MCFTYESFFVLSRCIVPAYMQRKRHKKCLELFEYEPRQRKLWCDPKQELWSQQRQRTGERFGISRHDRGQERWIIRTFVIWLNLRDQSLGGVDTIQMLRTYRIGPSPILSLGPQNRRLRYLLTMSSSNVPPTQPLWIIGGPKTQGYDSWFEA